MKFHKIKVGKHIQDLCCCLVAETASWFIQISKVPFGVHTINRNKHRLKTASCKKFCIDVTFEMRTSEYVEICISIDTKIIGERGFV
jgi:hypothetical protein